MANDFEDISCAGPAYRGGFRRAFLGEVAEPVVQRRSGVLRRYYSTKEGPAVTPALDPIVAAGAG